MKTLKFSVKNLDISDTKVIFAHTKVQLTY